LRCAVRGFELLDVFGPAELFSLVPGRLAIEFTGPGAGPVASSQGGQVTATTGYDAAATPGIMLIPGGQGTRRLVTDEAFLSWLRARATPASVVTSVCTGSAVLAAAGLPDGCRATSNKAAFEWVREQSGKVDWIAQARWVQDRDRWTSSGVAAGMDMAAALLADLACAGNFIRPGESSRMWISAVQDELVSPGGPACCGMMIGCAASTGLPGCDERVRVTSAASSERPGQGGGDPGAASPDRDPGAAAG
jgi:putative intracellular protease/amidase